MDMINTRIPINYDGPFIKTEHCSDEGSTCARTVRLKLNYAGAASERDSCCACGGNNFAIV